VGELIAEYNLPVLVALFVTILAAFLIFRLEKRKTLKIETQPSERF